MNADKTNGQEELAMQRKQIKIRLGLSLAALVTALTLVSGASARIPVEPGPGSPVSHSHPRQPTRTHAKKATRRTNGGYPATSGVHVKNPAEAKTE
jgi:hypothetical protein